MVIIRRSGSYIVKAKAADFSETPACIYQNAHRHTKETEVLKCFLITKQKLGYLNRYSSGFTSWMTGIQFSPRARVFSIPQVRDRPWVQLKFLSNGYRDYSPGGKVAEA
jgi:hypothetical protein